MEKVWSRVKQQVAANPLYGGGQARVAAAPDCFAGFMPDAALRPAAWEKQ